MDIQLLEIGLLSCLIVALPFLMRSFHKISK